MKSSLLLGALILVLLSAFAIAPSVALAQTLAPDGSYVGGEPTLAPDGSYVGGE
jgi:hypothetical protein